jgi:hypothetical protein
VLRWNQSPVGIFNKQTQKMPMPLFNILFNLYIDESIPVDRETKRTIRRSAWRLWNRNPVNGLIFGIGLLTPIFVFPWISRQLAPVQSWTGIPDFLLTFSLYVVYLLALLICMRRWRYAPYVYDELRDRGFDVCLKCGYWLKDLDNTVKNCPECGKERDFSMIIQPEDSTC